MKKYKILILNLLAMIVIALVLIFIVFKALNAYTRHGKAIVVPDAKGMSIAQARVLFNNEGLGFVISDSTYVKDKPAGIILDHNPQSGKRVKMGRMIYLTINRLTVPLVVVPDVADNSSMRQAEARVLAVGFKLDTPELINGEKDWVYGIKYNGIMLKTGDKAPTGATLTLVVGNGTSTDIELGIPEPVIDTLNSDESFF